MNENQMPQDFPTDCVNVADVPGTAPEEATILWHFTNPAALRSILANGLFGKDATKLDDKNECALHRLWLSPLTDCVRLAVSGRDKFPEATEKTGKNGILQGRFIVPFITCFSESPVYEYMWNEYTHEGGYAIGFDKKTIERYAARKEAYLETCHYLIFDELLQNAKRAAASVEKICEVVGKGKQCSRKTKDWLAQHLIRKLERKAARTAFAKDTTFILEQETRLVQFFLFDEAHKQIKQARADGEHIFVHLKGRPADYVRAILISPLGDVAANLQEAFKIADEFDIPCDRVESFRDSRFRTPPQLLSRPEIREAFEKWNDEGQRQ